MLIAKDSQKTRHTFFVRIQERFSHDVVQMIAKMSKFFNIPKIDLMNKFVKVNRRVSLDKTDSAF